MALTSRFATAKFMGGGAVRRPATRPTGAAPASQDTLGPQSVTAPSGPALSNPTLGGPSVMAPDASYEQSVGLLGQQRDIDLAKLQQAKQQALLQYGYTQDATGNLAFDAANPFSQAAMLKRNYDQAQSGNTNSYAARGQLYSGALQNAQNQTAFQNQGANNSLQAQLLGFLAANTGGVAQADLNYQSGLGSAEAQRIAQAQNNALYQAQLDAANAATAAPGQATKAAVKAAPRKVVRRAYGYNMSPGG